MDDRNFSPQRKCHATRENSTTNSFFFLKKKSSSQKVGPQKLFPKELLYAPQKKIKAQVRLDCFSVLMKQ